MKALKSIIGLSIILGLAAVTSFAQSPNTVCNDFTNSNVSVPCLEGHLFNVEGTYCITYRGGSVDNGWKSKWQYREKAQLTDVVSGEVYYGSAVANQTWNLHWWKPQTKAKTLTFTASLEDSEGNVIQNRHSTIHATINANGEPVVHHENIWGWICGGK